MDYNWLRQKVLLCAGRPNMRLRHHFTVGWVELRKVYIEYMYVPLFVQVYTRNPILVSWSVFGEGPCSTVFQTILQHFFDIRWFSINSFVHCSYNAPKHMTLRIKLQPVTARAVSVRLLFSSRKKLCAVVIGVGHTLTSLVFGGFYKPVSQISNF